MFCVDEKSALGKRLAFVPEGKADRSQARSDWKNATQKSRPVGYGVIEYEDDETTRRIGTGR